MSEMENQAELYYEKLSKSTEPGRTLLEFYRDITGKDAGRSEIIMINRLIKIFGRFTTYFAIMDLSKYEGKLEGNIYPLLYTICKNRFERVHDTTFSVAHESLDRELKLLQKEIEKVEKSKAKLPTSEGL